MPDNFDDVGTNTLQGYRWHPSQPPILLRDSADAPGMYTITASVPDGTKAITFCWRLTAAANGYYGVVWDVTSTGLYGFVQVQVANTWVAASGPVPLDADKKFKIQVVGGPLAGQVFLQTGYYL